MMSGKQSRIERLLEQRGQLVDKELSLLSVKVEPPELAEVVRYALALRGKRVRASLLTLACESVGGSFSRALIPAVVVEMVHNTSLILDDVIDASDLRRGRKTINARWGNNMALIACDAMLALAIREAVKADVKLTSSLIESASGSLLKLAEGETLELVRRDCSLADYFRIADCKTASLFRTAAESGVLAGGGSEEELDALRNYGVCLGIAFQIRDDVLDFLPDDGATGKPGLIDLKMDRPTLVLLLAKEDGLTREKLLMMEKADLLEALSPSIARAEAIARGKVEEALKALAPIRESEAKELLVELGDFVVARQR
jgi:geranylgeranyl diphosphate synthase, type I